MLASGMTADIPSMSAANGIRTDATTTSNAVTVSLEASSTQAAAKEVKKETSAVSSVSSSFNKGIESKVREYFADLPIMAEISKCESRYRQFSADGTVFRGIVNNKDVGVMQVNEYYHAKRAKKLGYDIYTLDGNMAYGRLLYEEEGTQPWVSSSPCWMKSSVAKAMFNTSNKLAEK